MQHEAFTIFGLPGKTCAVRVHFSETKPHEPKSYTPDRIGKTWRSMTIVLHCPGSVSMAAYVPEEGSPSWRQIRCHFCFSMDTWLSATCIDAIWFVSLMVLNSDDLAHCRYCVLRLYAFCPSAYRQRVVCRHFKGWCCLSGLASQLSRRAFLS